MRATRLTMICRGATVSARKGGFGSNQPLEKGQIEATAALAKSIKDLSPKVILCAPEISALQTATAMTLPDPRKEPALADIAYGRWKDRTLAEVAEREPAALQIWMTDPQAAPHGGESVSDLYARVSAWLEAHIAAGGHILAVSHVSVIRALVLRTLDAPLSAFWKIDVPPLSLTQFTSDGRRWALRAMGTSLTTI